METVTWRLRLRSRKHISAFVKYYPEKQIFKEMEKLQAISIHEHFYVCIQLPLGSLTVPGSPVA